LEASLASSPFFRFSSLIFFIAFVLGIIGATLNCFILDAQNAASVLKTYILFLGIAGFLTIFPRIQIWLIWRGTPSLHIESEYVIGEENIHIKNAVANASVQWEAFIKFGDTKSLFLIYVSKNLAHIIPKRTFQSPDQMDAFREILRRKIKKS
jgi:hypothetical protein